MRPHLVAPLIATVVLAATAFAETIDPAAPHYPGYTTTLQGTAGTTASVPCPSGILGASSVKTFGYVDPLSGLAVPGGVWTFDHMGSDPWEGWTRRDLTTNPFAAFRQINAALWSGGGASLAPPPIIAGTGSLWMGFTEREADSLCWNSGAGYGNRWKQQVESPPFENSAGIFTVEFDYWYDCESIYDQVRLILDDGVTPTTVATWSGQGGAYNAPLQFSQNFANIGVFTLRFEFYSDDDDSDRDGSYSTPYSAFGADDINLIGIEDVGGPGPPYEFETDLQGWSADPIQGVGSWAALNDWGAYGFGGCGQGGQVVTFHNESLEHPGMQHERIISPTVDISSFGAAPLNVWAEYDLYAQNPAEDNVYWRWGFRYWPVICPATGDSVWSDWELSGNFATFFPQCERVRSYANDSTSTSLYSSGRTMVPAGTDSVRLCFEVVSFTGLDSGNETPMFDNIEVGVSNASTILHVPSDQYPDIATALADVTPGDSVVVRPGTYTGEGNKNLQFFGISAAVVSEEGSAVTIIDCEGSGRAFRFGDGDPPTTLLQGFTLRRGGPDIPGNAIYILNGASPRIRDILVRDQFVAGAAYGTLRIDSGAPWIECTTVEHDTSVASGGLVIVNGGTPTFDTCVIAENVAQFSAVSLVGGSPQLNNVAVAQNLTTNAVIVSTGADFEGCTIANNSGVGMYFFPAPPSNVNASSFVGNGAGGIVLEDNSSSFFACQISLNEGAGVTMTNVALAAAAAPGENGPQRSAAAPTTTTMIDCVISGNVNSASSGGGILFDCSNVPTADFVPYYQNCTITGNASLFNGGGIAVCGVSLFTDIAPIFENCTVSSNTAGGLGGGMYCDVDVQSELYSGIVTMERSIMWGNCASGTGDQAYTELDNEVMFSCSDIDSAGIDGVGNIIYGGEQTYEDPEFCTPAECNASGTIDGEFTVATDSPVIPANSPCGQLIGSGSPLCTPPTDAGDVTGAPAATALHPNVPNPFNPVTTIRFDVSRSGPVTLVIYDVRGSRVRTLVDAVLPASSHARIWDGTDDGGTQVATGVYFARLVAGPVVETRKMVLVK